MSNLKLKLGLVIAIGLFFTASGSAAITSLDIVNVYPDQNVIETGTVPVIRLEADSTTTTTVNLYLDKPDGNNLQIGDRTLSVKSGNPRELSIPINGSVINQYGEYIITANETNNGLEQSLEFEVTPNTDISTSLPPVVYLNEEVEDFQIMVRTQSGQVINDDEIVPGRAEVYSINSNINDSGINKTLEESINLSYNKETNNIEGLIPLNGLEKGDYEVIGRFNVSSCSQCQSYESIATETLLIRKAYDRLTFQNKWSSYNAENILNNQASLKEDIADNDDSINDLQASIQSLGSEGLDHGKWIYRLSVLTMLFLIVLVIAYYSDK
jgi:hypothetical protein